MLRPARPRPGYLLHTLQSTKDMSDFSKQADGTEADTRVHFRYTVSRWSGWENLMAFIMLIRHWSANRPGSTPARLQPGVVTWVPVEGLWGCPPGTKHESKFTLPGPRWRSFTQCLWRNSLYRYWRKVLLANTSRRLWMQKVGTNLI